MIDQLIHAYPHSPLLVFIAIIIGSYIYEDGAILAAGLAAANHYISFPSALMAIAIGIMSGDIALYYLGRAAHTFPYLDNKLNNNRFITQGKALLSQNSFMNLFIIRFIPGLRTVCYSLSGYYQIPITTFVAAVFIATTIWTCLVFTSIYTLGSANWFQHSQYRWALLAGFVLLLLVFNLFMRKRLARRA